MQTNITKSVRLARHDDQPIGMVIDTTRGPGAVILCINSGGLAAQSGDLCVGDRIMVINGVDVENADMERVVSLLSGSPTGGLLELGVKAQPRKK